MKIMQIQLTSMFPISSEVEYDLQYIYYYVLGSFNGPEPGGTELTIRK